MQVVQSKAHTAGRRDLQGWGGASSEVKGWLLAPGNQPKWARAGLGADKGLPHWWSEWPVRVERLGTVFEIIPGIPISPFNFKVLVELREFHSRVQGFLLQNYISPSHCTSSPSSYHLFLSFF